MKLVRKLKNNKKWEWKKKNFKTFQKLYCKKITENRK